MWPLLGSQEQAIGMSVSCNGFILHSSFASLFPTPPNNYFEKIYMKWKIQEVTVLPLCWFLLGNVVCRTFGHEKDSSLDCGISHFEL